MRCIVNAPGKVGSDLVTAQSNINTAKSTASTASSTASEAKTAAEAATKTANDALAMGKKVASSISTVPVPILSLSYTGEEQSPSFLYDPDKLSLSGETSGTKEGTYTATFTPLGDCIWEDGTTDPKNVPWTIDRAPVSLPTPLLLTYTGEEQASQWENLDPSRLTAGGVLSAKDAGDYLATFTPTSSYCWPDGSADAREVTWTIARQAVSSTPSQLNTLTYTGEPQAPDFGVTDQFDLAGTLTGTAAGTYTALITPTVNYCWEDDTTGTRTLEWTIGKAATRLTTDVSELTLVGEAGIINCDWAGTGTLTAKPGDTGVCTASVSGKQVTVTPGSAGSTQITLTLSAGKNHKGTSAKVQVEVITADSTLANNDWATIRRIAQMGIAPEIWHVGDFKPVDGTGLDAFILGFDHNASLEGENTIHFQLGSKDGALSALTSEYNTDGGPYQAGTVPDVLPSDLQEVLQTVSKGGDAKTFLLSETEVFGKTTSCRMPENEQAQYAFYLAGNSPAAKTDGTPVAWWLRSVRDETTTCCVSETGAPGFAQNTLSLGIALGFCIS